MSCQTSGANEDSATPRVCLPDIGVGGRPTIHRADARGIPVATVTVGKAGAKNAAYLAAQILALSDPELESRIRTDRAANADGVKSKDATLQAELSA